MIRLQIEVVSTSPTEEVFRGGGDVYGALKLFPAFIRPTHNIWKIPGQGLNQSWKFNLHHSGGNARSLAPCIRLGIEPLPPQQAKQLQ